LLLGEGPLRADLEAEARALGVADVVRFLGHRTDLPRVLAAVDVSVLTSLWEGLPRVLVQSAAAGRPVVTFDVEGAWEVVRDGHNGFIVPSRDLDHFAARLEDLLRDGTLARDFGRAGRDQVGDAWTLETMLDRLDRMYQRVVSRGPPSSRCRSWPRSRSSGRGGGSRRSAFPVSAWSRPAGGACRGRSRGWCSSRTRST